MSELNIVLGGEQELKEIFGKLTTATDSKAILDESGALILNNIRDRFLAQINPEGQAWEQSKAAMRRAKTGRGGGTLYDTGRLFQSLQLSDDGPDGRRIGTNIAYAGFVNYGTLQIPPRIFMDFNAQDVELVTKLIVTRIKKAFA